MIWRWLLLAVLLIPAIGAGYMTWVMWRAGDTGKWLFLVFTLFFLLLAAAPVLPQLKPKPKPEPTTTGFAPHWFMLLAILVIVVSIILAIVGAILRR